MTQDAEKKNKGSATFL